MEKLILFYTNDVYNFPASLRVSFFSCFKIQIRRTKFSEFYFHDRKMEQATKMQRVITINKEFWYDEQKCSNILRDILELSFQHFKTRLPTRHNSFEERALLSRA